MWGQRFVGAAIIACAVQLAACQQAPAPDPLQPVLASLRTCRSDGDCQPDERCAPLVGQRQACTPTSLGGPALDPGPQGQPPPSALLWAGPQQLARAKQVPRQAATGSSSFAATVSGGLSIIWSVPTGGAVEGMAIGDLDDDNAAEIVTLVRGAEGVHGSIRAFNADGSVRWTYAAATELAGALTVADVDGDQRDEVAFCELSNSGMCRVLDEAGHELYAFGPFYVPGMNGGGPAAVDVNGDGAEDIIVATYGGLVVAVDGPSGTEMWRYDAWNSGDPPYHELFHGHPAVDDIDGDGTDEVVVGGAYFGGIFVINARTGAEELVLRDLWAANRNYFFGNGAALVDLDNDSDTLEILVSMVGDPGAVVVYNASGNEVWRVPAPGVDYSWITPVASDLDNDDLMEIVVHSRGSDLVVLDRTGGQLHSLSMGEASWASPSFVNADGDFDTDIIATGSTSLRLLDGRNLNEIGRYTADGGEDGLSPTALVADVDANGRADIITASYTSGELTRLGLGSRSSVSWYSSLGGGRRHNHRAPGGCSVVSGTPSASGGMYWFVALLMGWVTWRQRRRWK